MISRAFAGTLRLRTAPTLSLRVARQSSIVGVRSLGSTNCALDGMRESIRTTIDELNRLRGEIDEKLEPSGNEYTSESVTAIAGEGAAEAEPGVSSDTKAMDDPFEDIFADLLLDTKSEETKSPGLDQIFEELSMKEPSKEVDIDRTDEELLAESPSKTRKELLAEEKKLFQKIFDTYAQKEDTTESPDRLHEQVLFNLQDSFSRVSKTDDVGAEQVSIEDGEELQKSVESALGPTLEHLLALGNKSEVVAFAQDFFRRFVEKDYNNLYMYRKKRESMRAYTERHMQLCEEIKQQSEATPSRPLLNSLTMPLLFNHVLHLLSSQHYDGELVITLFNAAKADINLYTIVCNQTTYNEMLKVYWVYMGKCTLCEIELIVVEMMNNGFAGDMTTFSILKEILGTYHTMRMGQSIYNPGGQPIWSKEDERRAQNLGEKLRKMSTQLKAEKKLSLGYWKV